MVEFCNKITAITAVHAPVIALFRYFVIYCDNAALAEYPSLARMRDTEVYPIRSNITILAYYHVLTINVVVAAVNNLITK